MGQVGELVRTLRTQPGRVDEKSARAVLERAKTDGASPKELQELAQFLGSGQADKFSPELRDSLAQFVDSAHAPGSLPVADLLPDLEQLGELEDIPERFGADLVLLRDQLMGGGKLPKGERAERLMAFLVAYAERFVEVASGEAKVPTKAKPAEVLEGGLMKTAPDADGASTLSASTPASPSDKTTGKPGQMPEKATTKAPGRLPDKGANTSGQPRGFDGSPVRPGAGQPQPTHSRLPPQSPTGATAATTNKAQPPAHTQTVPQASEAKRQGALERFTKALTGGGFSELRDLRTGRDGVQIGVHLLEAASVAEVRARAAEVRLEAPQQPAGQATKDGSQTQAQASATASQPAPTHRTDVPAPLTRADTQRSPQDGASPKERARPDGERIGAVHADAVRVQPWQADAGRVLVAPVPRPEARAPADLPDTPQPSSKGVLGRNMLFNWLHTFRDGPTNEQEREEMQARLAFGAVMLLVGIGIVAILLISVA